MDWGTSAGTEGAGVLTSGVGGLRVRSGTNDEGLKGILIKVGKGCGTLNRKGIGIDCLGIV